MTRSREAAVSVGIRGHPGIGVRWKSYETRVKIDTIISINIGPFPSVPGPSHQQRLTTSKSTQPRIDRSRADGF
ncbi:cyclopropane-fatty-acyl-phospholipid synthase [Anopheles sinensis]|uniref:Cyclopropane-fatty-acyl-phospholipid synthase n=1 Tax=Anopheles sinensis TaxID=74873 RepID=A0A084WCH9_ANOSI|nr:cyclopropane-fatty-acyl-phospholipid synthase [Anopheles sinensis]